MKIEEMDLIEPALSAAQELQRRFPAVVFTSGRRTLEQQAHAMATNIAVAGRDWVTRTYRPSPPRAACEDWLERNPSVKDIAGIAAGLLSALRIVPVAELGLLSSHLGGLAFDIQPMAGPTGAAVLAACRGLAGLERLLTNEGGLVRWHLQFREASGDQEVKS